MRPYLSTIDALSLFLGSDTVIGVASPFQMMLTRCTPLVAPAFRLPLAPDPVPPPGAPPGGAAPAGFTAEPAGVGNGGEGEPAGRSMTTR